MAVGLRKWQNPSGTKTYYAWRSMRLRCQNKKYPGYKHYGGRGIYVCKRWRSYDTFVSDMGLCPDNMTLERKQTDGHYTPENCTWATIRDQLNNQRRNNRITHGGVTRTVSQWAEHLGILPTTLHKRLARMSISDALKKGYLYPVPECGKRSGYESGCRCRPCKDAHNKRIRDARAKKKAIR